jgi:hypothetical protein
MHINHKILFKILIIFCVIDLINIPVLQSQIIWENNNAPVYNYLDRMAQKGIVEFNNIIQPQTRSNIDLALKQIREKDSLLTKIEKIELNYYHREYKLNAFEGDSISFLNKDENKRLQKNIKEQERFIVSQEIVLTLLEKSHKNLDDVLTFISTEVQNTLHFNKDTFSADDLWNFFNELTYFVTTGFTTDKWIGEVTNNGVFPVIGFVSKKKAFTLEKLQIWIYINMDFKSI